MAEAVMQLYEAYKVSKNKASDEALFVSVQNEWRKHIRDSCTDVNCLLGVYKYRLKQLKN